MKLTIELPEKIVNEIKEYLFNESMLDEIPTKKDVETYIKNLVISTKDIDYKLINAAPELLEACKVILQNFEVNKKLDQTLSPMEIILGISILGKAINKATSSYKFYFQNPEVYEFDNN